MDITDFLGLQATHNPHRWVLPITSGIATAGRFMFGGCGLGAAILAMEHAVERPVVWATAQYLSFAMVDDIMDLDVTIAAAGKYTAQARVVGRVGDREILTVNAAFGDRPLHADGQWLKRPDVPSPDECPVRTNRFDNVESIMSRLDVRVAAGRNWEDLDGTPSTDGRSALWVRIPDLPTSAAALAILGDYVPYGISQTYGVWARSNSLDNTLRVIQPVETEWVLLDIEISAVHHGFGHGRVLQWAEDGTLMAEASQSAIVRELVSPAEAIERLRSGTDRR